MTSKSGRNNFMKWKPSSGLEQGKFCNLAWWAEF